MSYDSSQVARQQQSSILSTHKVLRNTYLLFGLTLLFSAGTAAFALLTNAAPLGFVTLLVGMFGLLFATQALRNSPWGLLAVFAYTGFMGYSLGPILNMYLHAFSNGSELISTALGITGMLFISLSAYVIATRKDFSYMGGFLFSAILVAVLLSIGSVLFNMPLLNLIISGVFALLSCGMVLYHTSNIIQGGERNYIMATISLYIAFFNLFLSLLRILSMFAGNRE